MGIALYTEYEGTARWALGPEGPLGARGVSCTRTNRTILQPKKVAGFWLQIRKQCLPSEKTARARINRNGNGRGAICDSARFEAIFIVGLHRRVGSCG